MKLKNQTIYSKATGHPGHIVRTYLDNLYIQFRYDADICIPLVKFDDLLITDNKTAKALNHRIKKLQTRTNNKLVS